MNVTLIGSGNVATTLGKLIKNAGHTFLQVISRNELHAKTLAGMLNAEACTDVSKINSQADIYIIAVSDNTINSIAEDLNLPGKIVVHTSGAASKEILKTVTENYGVFYPLQSIRKEKEETPVIPFLLDASNEKTLQILKPFAATVSENVFEANDEQRLKLHIAAIFVSNFTNHLFALAEFYCEQENIPFKMLIPLIQETALRLNEFSPKDVQTGPAIRNDTTTIQKHLQELNNYPELQKIYTTLTESILKMYVK